MPIYRYLLLVGLLFYALTSAAQENPPPLPTPSEHAAPQGLTQENMPLRKPGIPIGPDSVRFWPQSDFYLDATFGSFSRNYVASLSASQMYHVLSTRSLVLGYGARFSFFRGSGDTYSAAPARARNGHADSLFVDGATFYSLNLALNLRYRIFPRFDIGVNTDVAGFTFGPRVTGQYIDINNPEAAELMTARPTAFNLFLTGPRDRGTLNAEVFLVYHVRRNLDIRAGYNILTSEYSTDNALNFDNNRFRTRTGMVFVGITYLPFY